MNDFIYKTGFIYKMCDGDGRKNPETKKFPVWLLSHPYFYDMKADSFPVPENAENKPDLP